MASSRAPGTAPLPWLFPYVEEPVSRAYPPGTDTILRPVLEITIVGNLDRVKVAALVDSGSEAILGGPWIPRVIGVTPDPATEITIGIGGAPRRVRFADVNLRLEPPNTSDGEAIEWQTEVGFFERWEPPWAMVLGQHGFFDQFTVSMSRSSQAIAIDTWDAFDRRFGVQIEDRQEKQPRITP